MACGGCDFSKNTLPSDRIPPRSTLSGVEIITAPMVPPRTISSAVGAMISRTLPPSRINPPTIPEGGNVREIMAPTALLIVLGGTMGAVMISTPLSVLRGGMRSLGSVFFEKSQPPQAMIDMIVDYSAKARKSGIVALEQVADQAPDPFLRKALNLAVDGTDLQELRNMMELEIA